MLLFKIIRNLFPFFERKTRILCKSLKCVWSSWISYQPCSKASVHCYLDLIILPRSSRPLCFSFPVLSLLCPAPTFPCLSLPLSAFALGTPFLILLSIFLRRRFLYRVSLWENANQKMRKWREVPRKSFAYLETKETIKQKFNRSNRFNSILFRGSRSTYSHSFSFSLSHSLSLLSSLPFFSFFLLLLLFSPSFHLYILNAWLFKY